MRHLNDEERLLCHFGEPGAPEWAAPHLKECAECQREQERLHSALAATDDVLDAGAEPAPDFERRTWSRLEGKLVRRRSWWATGWTWRLPAWGALAASLVLAFLLGRRFPVSAPEPIPERVRERILLVAMGDHLERSKLVLLELSHAEVQAETDLRAERRMAAALLPANRIYRQAALKAGEMSTAHVLEEIERVLLDVAHQPDRVGASELTEIQRRIEARGLLLKVRVLDNRIRAREKPPAPPVTTNVS